MILINTKGKCLCTAVGCRLNINSSETTIHYHNITQWRCDPLDTMKHDRRSVSLSFFFIQSLYLPSFSLFIFRPPLFRHRARVGWRRCWEESCCREASCWSEAGMRGAVLLQSPGRNLTDAPIWPPTGPRKRILVDHGLGSLQTGLDASPEMETGEQKITKWRASGRLAQYIQSAFLTWNDVLSGGGEAWWIFYRTLEPSLSSVIFFRNLQA